MVPLQLKIEDSFFKREERDGFIVSLETKKVWAVELDLLNEFATVCKKYGLKWFAHAGTMLGAVRHQGFIPWDDDIDVVMPREDYDRLCRLAPGEFSHPYFFQCEDTDRFFARAFSRLRNSNTTAILENERDYHYPFNQGIFIDVFPLDHVPAEVDERSRFYKEIAELDAHAVNGRTIIHFYHPKIGEGLAKRIKYYLKHLYYRYFLKGGYRYYWDKHYERITQYNALETGWVGESVVSPLGRQLWRSEWVKETVMVPFEMLQVPIPVHFEECLSASFGPDWKMPRQIPNLHSGIFFDPDKPYTDYLAQK